MLAAHTAPMRFANRDGCSLYAKVLMPGGEVERPEHLCRFVTGPSIATQRLVLRPVIFQSCFGSALSFHLHVHTLVLDGACVSPREFLAPRVHPAAPHTALDVAELAEQFARRITRYLERQRRLLRARAKRFDFA